MRALLMNNLIKMTAALALLLAVMTTATAQSESVFVVGLKGGINFSTLQSDGVTYPSNGGGVNLSAGGDYTGFHGGLYAVVRFETFPLYFRPELFYSRTGGQVRFEAVSTTASMTSTEQVTFDRIELPLLVGRSFGSLRLDAGPVLGIPLSVDLPQSELLDNELTTDLNSFVFGFQAGVGLDLGKISLDIRYQTDFNPLAGAVETRVDGTTVSRDINPSTQQITLALGFRIYELF